MIQDRKYTFMNAFRAVLVVLLLLLAEGTAIAQETTATKPKVHGSVFGGGNNADVKVNTAVTMSYGTVEGNVYGGGNLGYVGNVSVSDDMRIFTWTDSDGNVNGTDVTKNTGVCNVTITNGTVNGNVFGAGKGKDDTFWCEKGIVYSTNVNVSAGTVNGNIYGGGEVGRVETDTQVKIGPDTGTNEPQIKGNVFGAGAGVETHGYSALVRGNTTVTVQSSAKVYQNVYGGGEIAAVGKYYLVDQAYLDNHPGTTLEIGMPYSLVSENLGVCNVTIKGSAVIGYNGTGHVFGAGKGKVPTYYLDDVVALTDTTQMPKRMMSENNTLYTNDNKDIWGYIKEYPDNYQGKKYVWEYFDTREKYHTFLQTLALATRTVLSVEGSAKVNGSVYGGSESGFVQHNTSVTIQGESTIGINGTAVTDGNVFGGGLGLDIFAEAGRVSGNATVNVNGGTVWRNVYGGGSLGPVGNYYYEVNETTHSKTYTWTEGGTCNVNIDALNDNTTTIKGDVFGAGKGSNAKYECEPAMALQSNVIIYNGTVNGTVYGGGEVGRVDQNTSVTIGKAGDETSKPDIKGDVFGAGAGVETHGYSALVRGNATVILQGKAKVGKSVYGGGKTASVGRFVVDAVTSLPKQPVSGGICTVNILGESSVGYNSGGDVYGACKGVEPGNWSSLPGHVTAQSDDPIKFTSEADYLHFLKTLALTSNTEVTIGGSSTVNGSVYGGGQRGITLAGVKVDMTGGTVNKDVYGGGALADTNTENWDDTNNTLNKYHEETRLASGSSVVGYYTKSGDEYTLLTSGTTDENTTYYRFTDTKVNLLGGLVKGDAYGGGLGQLGTPVEGVKYTQAEADAYNTENSLQSGDEGYKTTDDWKTEPVAASEGNGAVKAMVYGDVTINLGKANADGTPDTSSSATAFDVTLYNETGHTDVVKSGRIFGCNNLNGSPMGNVTVTVNKTVAGNTGRTAESNLQNKDAAHTYELADVYGGGNLANYTPKDGQVKVIINSCNVSVQEVYGGGNAAAVPATDVEVRGAYEIAQVFGGGNGEDDYNLDGVWHTNSGANVGGDATTLLTGGYIHEAYGGSNSKGTISGDINISKGTGGACSLTVEDLYGAGKDADVEGDLIMVMGCSETRTENIYGCSMNANVKGNVELTITSGEYGKVFGGNNKSGAIFGHIIVNIEETGCTPIIIDELYACGNDAAYSVYGYYQDGVIEGTTKPKYVARTSLTDEHTAVTFENKPNTEPPYADPELNIISCTRIGKVFGGGYGAGATVYGNPKVNINMMLGKHATDGKLGQVGCGYTDADNEAVQGGVFGGGNEAKVEGNTTVNIGNRVGEEIDIAILDNDGNPVKDSNGNYTYTKSSETTVTGANITGNVYGGGNLADVTGNTFVNICAKKSESGDGYEAVTEGTSGVTIGGTVFGGGKGKEDTFLCEKAMIGENNKGAEIENYPNGNTSVRIGHGTVTGSVYGGGEVGRVEMNTVVEIGYGNGGSGTKSPVIEGNVFGAGKGVKTHGYSALVRGNPHVTIQGDTWVKKSVYGGGEIASVARYKVAKSDEEGAPYGVEEGEPYLLENSNCGYCYVTVKGNAEIGTSGMKMYHDGDADDKPDDWGHVFAAGKGVLPDTYDFANFTADERENYPKRMALYDSKKYLDDQENKTWEYVDPVNKDTNKNIWEYFNTEEKYFTFIRTLGLATQTYVYIGNDASGATDNPLVYGSVYGGSENGLVQFDTNVYIKSGQIGCGDGVTGRYNSWPIEDESFETSWTECSHWTYTSPYAPYDPNAKYKKTEDSKYYYDSSFNVYAEGGTNIATDGHTYYGNVFGGGSGSIPYFDFLQGKSRYIMSAGQVKGNTNVTITGGHILTNVYGGCEATDVDGTANVTMTGGTIGVPRTDTDIINHPVTGYLFGGGKGDQRVFFNKDTNVRDAVVTVEGGRIYGSVYGGGEDGHVLRNVTMTIGKTGNTGPTIGTRGTSYYDGHVFGGGRGFGGEALTAGNVGGAVTLDILGGSILGNVYGGGRLASVGYGLYLTDEEGYGEMRANNQYDGSYTNPSTEDASAFYNKGRGKIFVTVSGGTIGNDVDNAEYGGHVFGGSMGRLSKLDGNPFSDPNHWQLLATAKQTTVNVTNGVIKRSVFGGGEMGTITENTNVTVSGGTIGTLNKGAAEFGNVYGGGKGLTTETLAGVVKGNTIVTINGTNESPKIYHNIYGGGAYGSVGTFDLSAGMPVNWTENTGKCTVTVNGGDIGTTGKENGMIFGSSRGDVATPVDGVDPNDKLAWVYDTHVTIGTQDSNDGPQVNGSVYGSGENGHVYTNTLIDIHSGTIGITDTSIDGGARYAYRGNVYGGGCGTDTYTVDEDNDGTPDVNAEGKTKKYYNPLAGIVYGTTTVNMDGGHVVHNVYGAGAMGSVGKFTFDGTTQKPTAIADGAPENSGKCFVNISGGKIGMTGMLMTATDGPDNYGHVFGAGRGELHDPAQYTNLEVSGYVNNTYVTISDEAFVTGSVYGGGENGHVLGNTSVTVSGGQIGCGDGETGPYTSGWDGTSMKECASWPYTDNGATYDMYAGTPNYNSEGGSKEATDGHTFYGNVFGGGSGYTPYAAGQWMRSAGRVEGNTFVTIEGGHILTNVYGGNEQTDVGNGLSMETGKGKCTVTMTGGTVGVPRTHSERLAHPVTGNLFGAGKGDKRVLFNRWTNVGSTEVSVSGGTVYGSVFGGGEDGHVLGNAKTTISGTSTVIGTLGTTGSDGNVFGGGRGSVTALTAGVVCGDVSLDILGGMIKGSVYGGGRLASLGTYLVAVGDSRYGKQIPDGDATHGHVAITISGGTIGALDGEGKVKVSANSIGDVYGGCKGTTEGELHEVLGVSKSAIVNLLGGTVGNSIYGGGEVGNVGELGVASISGETVTYEEADKAFAKVNLLGGSVKNVYGGGLGKKTSTIDAKALVKGDVTVNLNGLEAGDYDAAIHSGSVSQANVEGEAVYYRVADGDNSGCVVNGTIFGCNNINGTPEGHAKVHVFKTTKRSGQATVGLGDDVPNAYDVVAVYGGGNQADYVPTNADPQKRTEVIIEGCDRTSIHNVYGGGNAAASPGTLVTVKGSKMIYEVFGGGNGVSTEGFENPGANIGFRTDRTLEYKDKEGNVIGDGKALVQLMSGNIKYAYGGSNTKGDIRGTSNVVTVDNEYIKNPTACCEELVVDHMFGGGKNAGMKSGANIILGCSNSSTWVKEIYAGAENADVLGDVSLTITSGKFGRVFGGNKTSGKLEGSITVNIEENGQCGIPVIIGELYGGGNKAAYSIYGFDGDTPRTKEQYNALSDAQKAAIDLEQPHHSPVVNVRAFTSIGNIFGGGYGDEAVMYGDPTVNINEVPITHTDDDATYSGNQYTGETLYFVNDVLDPTRTATTTQEGDYILTLPDHEDQKMGAINNVFGGGNAAAVYGNTLVNIAVTSEEPLQQLDEQGNPKYTDVAKTIPEKVNKEVKGADIRGNVYGGGNKAEVTGDTNVVIGRQETETPASPARSSEPPSESQPVTP